MRKLNHDALKQAIRQAGVAAGDIVHVQSDLRRIGPVDCPPRREDMLAFYLAAFQEVLGPEGTLTVCTAFEDYGRYQTPFILEESPSLTDTFSDYVRIRPGAVRSCHPIVSVTGLGGRAQEICDGPHFDGFGYDSPWGRLHRANAWIMTLGLGPQHGGTTFCHYLEGMYGAPYKYTKLYKTPVYAGGQEVKGTFTMSVRYLDFGIAHYSIRLKQHLLELGRASNIPLGGSFIWCAAAQEIFEVGIECLRRDRYFLLEQPPRFRRGEIPCDGPTGPLQDYYDQANNRPEGGLALPAPGVL